MRRVAAIGLALLATASLHSSRAAAQTPDTSLTHALSDAKQHGWRIRITTDSGVSAPARISTLERSRLRLVGNTIDLDRIRMIERRSTTRGGGKSLATASALLVGGAFGYFAWTLCDCADYKKTALTVGGIAGAIAGGIGWLVGNLIHPPVEHWYVIWSPR